MAREFRFGDWRKNLNSFRLEANAPGVVATIYLKKPQTMSQWLDTNDKTVVNFLVSALASCDPGVNSWDQQWPEHSKTVPLGRVINVYLPTTSSPTLAECHDLLASHAQALDKLQHDLDIELIVQPYSLFATHRDTPGLAVFDMDSTLIQQEVIDELARAIGRYDEVAAITEAAMRGEAPYTDFEASLRARVALLKGVPTSIWEDLKRDVVTFTPGARELVKVLRARRWKTAVLSGGFTPLATWVAKELGLDYAFANHLVEDPETKTLTGKLVDGTPIVHAQKKLDLLRELAEENEIPLERTIAVGDGSNDLLMLGAAGLGVAFNAKPKVQKAAPTRLNGESLLDVAYLIGCTRRDVDAALAGP
ncbi:Phosphoserine phosphatase [Oleoguttula sp. CCFEE 5521]